MLTAEQIQSHIFCDFMNNIPIEDTKESLKERGINLTKEEIEILQDPR